MYDFPKFLEINISKYCNILHKSPKKIAKIISNKHLEVYGEKLEIDYERT